MIELINHLPDNVVGIVTRGRVTREECDNVLRPAMDASARRHGKVRLYYEIGSRYPGAGWDELDIGASRLERIALVSDAAWMRWIINALRPAIACEVRVFSMDEAEEGLAWLSASAQEPRAVLDAPGNSSQPLRSHPPLPPRSRRSASRHVRAGSRRYLRRAPEDRQVH
jgi:stage II sporulation SpoAA-like protein